MPSFYMIDRPLHLPISGLRSRRRLKRLVLGDGSPSERKRKPCLPHASSGALELSLRQSVEEGLAPAESLVHKTDPGGNQGPVDDGPFMTEFPDVA